MALTEAKHSSLLKSAGSSLQSFYGGLIHPAHTHTRAQGEIDCQFVCLLSSVLSCCVL